MERTIYAVSRRASRHAPTRSIPRPASNPFAHPSHPSHPSHTFRTPSDSTPAQHPLHNSHAIPRGANLDRPHKPHNSAIVDSKFERLTGKLHATLWGNHRRNAGGQGAAEPRTRPSSSARPAPTAGRTAPHTAQQLRATSPYCRSDSSRFARTTMPMRVTIC